jgi:hypothetical protein
LLRFYPRAHREQFGALMLQHFRDQCRDASELGLRGCLEFAVRFGGDFFSSLIQENLSSTQIMIRQLATHPRLPLVLLIVGLLLGLGAANLAASGQTTIAVTLAYASLLLLVVRGAAETQRPAQQWLRGLGSALVILVAYGFIMPIWGRFHLVPVAESGALVFLLFAALGSNLVVPLGKAIIALRARVA